MSEQECPKCQIEMEKNTCPKCKLQIVQQQGIASSEKFMGGKKK